MNQSLPDWQLPPGVTRALWDYLHNPHVAGNYDHGLAGSPLAAVDSAFAWRHLDKLGRLIDLGCGTGRLAVEAAARGMWVLGVDLSEEMLRLTLRKAADAGVHVHALKANLVELHSLMSSSFDYAACLFSTLGMIDGAVHRQRAVNHIHRLLRPGGKLVLHVHNWWFNIWDGQGRKWLLRDLFRSALGNPRTGNRMMPTHQGVAQLKLHHFTRREVTSILKASGFRIVEVLPLGLAGNGMLGRTWWLGWLRAYGYLLAAEKTRESH